MTNIHVQIEDLKCRKFDQALGVLFTPWQVSILRKRAGAESLSGAERQELSRRIKPKLLAIDALHDLKLLHPFFD